MLDEHDQLAVIRGLRDGCREAWGRLYDAYSAEVWRYVARLLGPRPGAVADVVQEVFLAAAVAARQFDADRGNLASWLTGIAHHKVVAHWRQAARAERVRALARAGAIEIRHWLDGQTSGETRDGELDRDQTNRDTTNRDNTNHTEDAAVFEVRVSRAGPTGAASSDGASDSAGLAAAAFTDTDLADLIRAVLAELPADYAALLTAKYLDDRTLVDLARELGATVDATKSKLARARREFRAKFEFLSKEPIRSALP